MLSNEDDRLMIVEAIWDYNEFFQQRFHGAITHKRTDLETMNCPRSCLHDQTMELNSNDENADDKQARQQQNLAISELFFYAYSHKYIRTQLKESLSTISSFGDNPICNSCADDNETSNASKQEIEREVHRIFTHQDSFTLPLLEKVVKSNKIVCMFLPIFNTNSVLFNECFIERLKANYSTIFDIYCTRETGMVYMMKDSNLIERNNQNQQEMLHDCNSFYRQQLKMMKENYEWRVIEDHNVSASVCNNDKKTTNFRVFAQISPQLILKTATDSFNDFCHFYSIAAEFATGMYLTESSIKALSRVYSNQIEKERRGEFPVISDHVIIIENGKAASIGMIVYSKALNERLQNNGIATSNDHHDYASIYSIATREKFRGKGYATMIVITLLELAKRRGYTKVILHASEQGCGLYSKLGFEKKMQIDVCSVALLSTEK
ncbi:hypothetical protein C9374_000798 [Naegleria lovaniensis]|uniref:N-acetyltransferase domain-containing protein n=1 Tax=Naegleria lovaniensis TaxID=51637 RepID=A0AA88GX23_NAELO|nr:uncharacterized protein C9374_000798 [Naegleria lovaniensis]KAG2387948.1 hypothetical protein C9374_000798 [Naegleria lovaniensis]